MNSFAGSKGSQSAMFYTKKLSTGICQEINSLLILLFFLKTEIVYLESDELDTIMIFIYNGLRSLDLFSDSFVIGDKRNLWHSRIFRLPFFFFFFELLCVISTIWDFLLFF